MNKYIHPFIDKCARVPHDVYRKNLVDRDQLSVKSSNRRVDTGMDKEKSLKHGYSWVPPGLTDEKIKSYFSKLPINKVPRLGTPGHEYRELQLMVQLPKQDLALAYCKFVEQENWKQFEDFVNHRNEHALDIGYVRPSLDKKMDCRKCGKSMAIDDIAVIAPKFGEEIAWHPACFSCTVCDELLVDLTYCCGKDRKLLCERHYGETIKPRCSACDELIFSGEYTKAMSKDWHSGHFNCYSCDAPLTGHRYVLREEHPHCIKCYETNHANVCEECKKPIGIDSKVVEVREPAKDLTETALAPQDLAYKEKHWHDSCFLCNKCKVSLVDKSFGSKSEQIFCGTCYDSQFSIKCDGCGDVFKAGTKKMEYKGKNWHENCFTCNICKTPIGNKSFIPKEDEVFCSACFENKFATRCVKCKEIIQSGGVTYKSEPWHKDCFVCGHCGVSLASQRFTTREEKPYCASCFGELYAKKCEECKKPITGGSRFISFEDRNWHNECFNCFGCKNALVGKGFLTDGPDILCPDCAKNRLI